MCFVLQLYWFCKLHKSDTISSYWRNTYALGHVWGYKTHFFQIRVKHMISQGGLGQGHITIGYNRKESSGRMLETNTENLLRMVFISRISCVCFQVLTLLANIYFQILLLQVSYCENEVDCRRFLQLVHLGEKFDSTNCQNTCDNCSSSKSLIDKDVTVIARQLV